MPRIKCKKFPDKNRYPTEWFANEIAFRIKKSDGKELRSYYCNYCCGYHLTHLRKEEQKDISYIKDLKHRMRSAFKGK